jgi:hypothetical protein
MSKINKEIAVFIVFLTLLTIYGLWNVPIIDIITLTQRPEVAGFLVQFESGTTEPEVKAILENYNMILNYSMDCNWDNGAYKYYIKVNEDKRMDIINELKKDENWTDSMPHDFKKGNYYIIPVTETATQDKNFLEMLEINNLQVKKFVWCLIRFGDGSNNYIQEKNWITERDAIRIKNELEANEKVLTVMPSDICY